jgi:sec-independent protein translocase protein TatA
MLLANLFGFANPWDVGIIAVVVVVLFGGSKIAGFGKNLGESLKEFKKATREDSEVKETTSTVTPAPADSTTKVD